MKSVFLVAIWLTVISICYGFPPRHEHERRKKDDDAVEDAFESIVKAIKRNPNIQAKLVEALNSSGLSQYIITLPNGQQKANLSALSRNYFSIVPTTAITSFLNQSFPRYNREINCLLTAIDNLQQNTNGTQSQLGGYLIYKGYSSDVSCGASGGLTVNLTNVLADASQSAVLSKYTIRYADQICLQSTAK